MASGKDVALEVLYKLQKDMEIKACKARDDMRKAMVEVEELEKVIQKIRNIS